MTSAVTGMFLSAVQIAGPLLVVLFLADVGLGLLTRVAPALNAFSLGFPLKIMLTLGARRLPVPRAAADRLHPRRAGRQDGAGGGLMADSQEKTEQATDKRMREVRSKGQLSRSQDLTAWLAVGAAAVMIPATVERGANAATDQLFSVRGVMADPDPAKAVKALDDGLGSLAGILSPMLVVVLLGVLVGSALQGGIHVKKFRAGLRELQPAQRAQAHLRQRRRSGAGPRPCSRPPSSAWCSTRSCRG